METNMVGENPTAVADDLAGAPVNDQPLSHDEGDEAIAALLGDPDDEDPAERTEGDESAEETTDETPPDEDEEVDPESLTEDDEAVADDEADGSEDEIKGGRFAPDTAKVTLEDGSVITVAELKRNNLFQRDYSKKTEEVARQRDEVTAKATEVSQISEQLAKEREFALWYIENNIPQEPQRPSLSAQQDPMAWLQYQEQMGQYNSVVQAWQTMHQSKEAESQRKQGETKAEFDTRVRTEFGKLVTVYPHLKDDAKRVEWFEDTFKTVEGAYGFTRDELNGVTDSRMIRAMRDAALYRKAKAKAPTVKKDVQNKPALVTGSGKRQSPEAQAVRSSQKVVQRLRDTGNVRDADDAILRFLS